MSLGDSKDEIIMMLKKKYEQVDSLNKTYKRQVEEFKKGTAGWEAQKKGLEEMQSQKIKTLLKSINNLKKEVAREKFEKKDNVRIQKLQKQEKDMEMLEIGMNALRNLI